MTFQYKGRGFLQGTGRNNMALSGSPITIGSQGLSLNNMNTITLSNGSAGISGYSSQPWDVNLFGSTHDNLKKFEMYESTEDIVALACAAERLFQEYQVFYKVTDRELYKKLETQDREKAKEIKDYYSKKVMMLKLKGTGSLSTFREEMNKLIHSDGLVFKESMIGIAYWLPKFYAYDSTMDSVKSQIDMNQNFDKLNSQGVPGIKNLSVNLTPIKRVVRLSKRNKHFEYWFKDDTLNAGVVINLEQKNQLQHLWDYLFENEKNLKVKGNYVRRKLDDFEYYSITNWELDRG